MARNNSIQTSNNAINPFQKFSTKLALELLTRDVVVLKNLTVRKIPDSVLEEIKAEEQYSGVKWLACVTKHKLIWENNVSFLIEALETANRFDLAKKAREYQEEIGEAVREQARTRILVPKPMPSDIFSTPSIDCLPLFFAAEMGYATGGTNICKRMINACAKVFNTSHQESPECEGKMELHALVKYGNHGNSKSFVTMDVAVVLKNMESFIKCHSFCGGRGGTSGIADALAKFVDHVQRSQMPRELPKLCILICFITKESFNLEYFRCPHGKDAIKLSHTLAESAIPLYIIGIDLEGVQACLRGTPLVTEENHFLSGITLIGGGQYFQVNDINHVGQAIQCIIKENASIEKNMGTVNDITIQERNKENGDLNVEHLAELIQEKLNLRSCTVDSIDFNNASPQPISQLVQRVAWADNLDDAIDAVKSCKEQSVFQKQDEVSKYQTRSINISSTSSFSPISYASYPSASGVSNASSFSQTTQNSQTLQFREQNSSRSRSLKFSSYTSTTESTSSTPPKNAKVMSKQSLQMHQMMVQPTSNQSGRKRKEYLTPATRAQTKRQKDSQSTSQLSSAEITMAERQRVSMDVARRMLRRQITRQAYYKTINY